MLGLQKFSSLQFPSWFGPRAPESDPALHFTGGLAIEFNPAAINILGRFDTIDDSQHPILRHLPIELAQVTNTRTFDAPLPVYEHVQFLAVPDAKRSSEIFSPTEPILPPLSSLSLRAFASTIVQAQKRAGNDVDNMNYDLRTKVDRRRFGETLDDTVPDNILHPDYRGGFSVQCFSLSDRYAPTIFENGRRAIPYTIMLYSGMSRHRAGPVLEEFRDEPCVVRQLARIRAVPQAVLEGLRPH